jgi:uncharacterized protein
MKIRVDKISEEGQDIETKFEPAEMSLDFHGYSLREDIFFVGRATKSNDDVHIEGTLRGAITSECSRCLASFLMPIDMAMNILYVPERDPATREEEMVLELVVDRSFYKEDVIDLLHEAKELLFVNLPVKPVCRDECKGLCPQCGADLNVAACGCELHAISSPFEELKDLKGKLKKKQKNQGKSAESAEKRKLEPEDRNPRIKKMEE